MSNTKTTNLGPRHRNRSDRAPPSASPPWDVKRDAGEAGADDADSAVGHRQLERRMVDWAKLHMLCRRKACRRAGACTEPEIPCYREHASELRRYVFPKLREHLRAKYPPPRDHSGDRPKPTGDP